jgi:hypothetical protein
VTDTALLLTRPAEEDLPERLEGLLAFFGVPSERKTPTQFLASGNSDNARLFCAADTFLEIAAALEANPAVATKIHSAFVCAGNNLAELQYLAQKLSGDASAKLLEAGSGTEWEVTDKFPEFCRSMSGLRMKGGGGKTLSFDDKQSGTKKILFGNNGPAFVRFEFSGVPIFLSTAGVIDVSAPLSARDFDIRVHLLAALPAVLFAQWAFAETCWQPAELCACMVIDDPLLTPHYGFLHYDRLLGLMERYGFSTSIAFIPWNWNRSSRKTVKLFQEHSNRFSVSIHGCDHTGGEFGGRNRERLAWRSRQALQRMAMHEKLNNLPHDRVMVFPQGVFSEASMDVLKRTGFVATVNSEVASADPQPRAVSVADYWSVAVMNFGSFPIFTRRSPWMGVENLAFDILLGKPCLICVHHNDFHDDARHVEEFLKRLIRLNVKLRWTSLAEVARRSFRQRDISADAVEVEIFSSEARMETQSAERRTFRIRKRESVPESINEIRVGNKPVKWTAAGNEIVFETELNPGAKQTIAIAFSEPAESSFRGETLSYRLKATMRRRLCEFRDNYLKQKIFSE